MTTPSLTEKEFREILDKVSILGFAETIIQDGLDKFDKDITLMNSFKIILQEYLQKVKNRKIEFLYTLHCDVTDGVNSLFVSYYDIGLFSTYEEAEKYIPENGVLMDGETSIKVTVKVYRNNGTISLEGIDKPVTVDELKKK